MASALIVPEAIDSNTEHVKALMNSPNVILRKVRVDCLHRGIRRCRKTHGIERLVKRTREVHMGLVPALTFLEHVSRCGLDEILARSGHQGGVGCPSTSAIDVGFECLSAPSRKSHPG